MSVASDLYSFIDEVKELVMERAPHVRAIGDPLLHVVDHAAPGRHRGRGIGAKVSGCAWYLRDPQSFYERHPFHVHLAQKRTWILREFVGVYAQVKRHVQRIAAA